MKRFSDKELSNILERSVYTVPWNMKCDKIYFYKFKIYRIVFCSDYYNKTKNHQEENYISNTILKNSKTTRIREKYKITRNFRIINHGEKPDKLYRFAGNYEGIIWLEGI